MENWEKVEVGRVGGGGGDGLERRLDCLRIYHMALAIKDRVMGMRIKFSGEP
jgi:hypothetical protein